ncbi:MAG: Na+/H+ antiporter subunit C [Melioribacteraceae bacterium]|nr:Na+/H+ antiporter subunit C [Melioribacteraceae bacterium]
MNLLFAVMIGVLYGAGFYLILRRSFVKVLIGLILLAHGANLLILTVGRLTKGNPVFVNSGTDASAFADPLPQALILTAIVIGFGIQAFALVLFKRAYKTAKTDDLDEMRNTDLSS